MSPARAEPPARKRAAPRGPQGRPGRGGRAIIVLPARLASTRLPRKLLLAETGRPLLAHAVEGALANLLKVAGYRVEKEYYIKNMESEISSISTRIKKPE